MDLNRETDRQEDGKNNDLYLRFNEEVASGNSYYHRHTRERRRAVAENGGNAIGRTRQRRLYRFRSRRECRNFN
ncbi:protein of unknown function [Serratia sp. Tan611]|nr:protein of unknown function [Serratia sp. Tan611]